MKVNDNPAKARLALLERIKRLIEDRPQPWPGPGPEPPSWAAMTPAHFEMQKALLRAGVSDASKSLNVNWADGRWRNFAGAGNKRASHHVAPLRQYARAVELRQKLLAGLVDTYLAAEGDLQEWERQRPQLAARLSRHLDRLGAKLTLTGKLRLPFNLMADGTILLSPTQHDKPLLRLRCEAYVMFLAVAAPTMLGLPESKATLRRCERCGRLFVHQSGRRDRRHCSRDCAARAIVEQTRRQEKEQQIQLAQDWYQRWRRLKHARQDWKTFVVSRTRGKVTKKFLTRNQQQVQGKKEDE